jgi:hypothetical protein
VRPAGVEKTSRLCSRDPVASGVKCGAAWWKEWRDEVGDGFLVEPQNQGRAGNTWESSHDWRLTATTLSSLGFQWFTRKLLVPWLIHKAKAEEPETELQQLQTGLTGGYRSDRCATTQSGDFEAKDTHQNHNACVVAKQVCGRWASVRWSDDKDFRIRPQGACIPS